jgi:adenylate kinase
MLVLDVDHDQLVDRLLKRADVSGRADDQDVSVIENRIDVYKAKTEPIIAHYRKVGKYEPVNGMGDIEDIFDRLSTQIKRCL